MLRVVVLIVGAALIALAAGARSANDGTAAAILGALGVASVVASGILWLWAPIAGLIEAKRRGPKYIGKIPGTDPPLFLLEPGPVPKLPVNASDSHLLVEAYGVVTFLGREQELRNLHAWLVTEPRIAVLFIHAEGGTGKSRLARKLGEEARGKGWIVTTVSRFPTRTSATSTLEGLGKRRGLLVIVDYADRMPAESLTALRQHLASTPATLRVLLLGRSEIAVPTEAQLWEMVGAGGVDVGSQPLGPVVQDDIAALAKEAQAKFGEQLGVSTAGRAPVALADLGAKPTALEVLIRALLSVLAARDESAGITRAPAGMEGGGPAEQLLVREVRQWRETLKDETAVSALTLTTLVASLTGAIPRADAARLLKALGVPKPPLDAHQRFYPSSSRERALSPLLPDFLAEEFIAAVVSREDDQSQALAHGEAQSVVAALVTVASAATPRQRAKGSVSEDSQALAPWAAHAATMLIEAGRRHAHIRQRVLNPAIEAEPHFALAAGASGVIRYVESSPSEAAVRSLNDSLNDLIGSGTHLDWDPASVATLAFLVKNPDLVPAEAVMLHNDLSVRLASTGRREEALEPAQRALALLEALAKSDPSTHTLGLAMVLANLAQRLVMLGRHREALDYGRRAVDLCEALAKEHLLPLIPHLARSLDTYAVVLSRLGLSQEALEPARRAVELDEVLARADAVTYAPQLAASLNNLANRFAELGRFDDALEPTQRAVDLREALAKANPAAHTADLAMSLRNLAVRLSQLGQGHEALAPALRAVDLLEILAKANPAAHRPDLAMALNNLAVFRLKMDRSDEALESAQRAVELHWALANINPRAHAPGLAMSLQNLATVLAELGRGDEALEPAQRSVDLRGELTRLNPSLYAPELVASLDSQASLLSRLGRPEDALEPASRAVVLREKLATAMPADYTVGLAASLNNLANRFSELDRLDEALEPMQRAIGLREALAKDNPSASTPNLAVSLMNLGGLLSKLDRPREALEPAQRAVGLFETLARGNPALYAANLARALNNLANLLSEVGREVDAEKVRTQLSEVTRQGADGETSTEE